MVRNINGTAVGETLVGTTDADHLRGLGGRDAIYGDGFAPGFWPAPGGPPHGGAPVYLGGGDKMWGGDGADWLSGGHGADWLSGGAGADRFAFGTRPPPNPYYGTPGTYALDTGVGRGERDVIRDFEQGADRIDLSLLLTFDYRHLGLNAAYEFIGTREFTGDGPQVRYEVQGGRTIVQIDGENHPGYGVDTVDGEPDAEIELVGKFDLTKDAFIL